MNNVLGLKILCLKFIGQRLPHKSSYAKKFEFSMLFRVYRSSSPVLCLALKFAMISSAWRSRSDKVFGSWSKTGVRARGVAGLGTDWDLAGGAIFDGM